MWQKVVAVTGLSPEVWHRVGHVRRLARLPRHYLLENSGSGFGRVGYRAYGG